MRRTALLFFTLSAFLIFLSGPVKAESNSTPDTEKVYLPEPLVSQLSADGKTLFKAGSVKAVVVDPNPTAPRRKIPAPTALTSPPEAATASFSITYVPNGGTDLWGEPCYTFPESAKAAFNAATSIWANTITSSVPITIKACWANLASSTTLGYAGGANEYRDFANSPRANTWYRASLANSLSGSDLGPGEFDMHITYNQNFAWYYGTDGNTPIGQYDLMTVVLHEIAHGLNFAGSMQYSGGIGSWGYGTGYPNTYDVFMRDGAGTQLINTGTYPNNSAALGSALVSNNIWFHGTEAIAANGSQRVKMYAPATWSGGSSYSHLDYSTFNNTANQLMVYAVSDGESVHDPGVIAKGLLKDLGWILSVPSAPAWVSATDGAYTDKISLTWAAVSGATGYNVYYAESLTGTKYFISSTANTSMDLIGATPEYVYYFWVSASNQGGEGALSNYDTGYMAGIYYTVSTSKSGTGSGTVSSVPAGISCGADCTENYLAGTSVTLSASANTGSKAAWSDCAAQGGVVAGNNTSLATCTFSSLDANKTVTATFTLNTYTVTANAGGNGAGTVSSNVGGINYTYPGTNTATTTALNHGSSIILTASAGTGSRVSWSGCASTGGTSSASTCTFSSLDASKTVTATFVPTCFQDSDQDNYGSIIIIDDDGDGVCETVDGESTVSTDCNDSNAAVHPGATELAGDGVDQNCDTQELCYVDMDNDSYRPDDTSTKVSTDVDCLDSTEAISSDPTGDCNDTNASINPGAAEVCDGVDNDCSNAIDDNLIAPANTLQQGVCAGSTQSCTGAGGWVDNYSGVATYEPNTETTCDTLDNDCDGTADETLTTTYYEDADTDTYGNPSVSQAVCSQPAGYVLDGTDCNDSNAAVHPGATELAGDGVDQNCDTQELCYVDMDNDSYRPDDTSTKVSTDVDCLDSTEAISSDPTGDCNDSVASINPGAAELAGDGVDQNCDGNELCYQDEDGDTYGTSITVTDNGNLICADTGESTSNTDCDDTIADINPGAAELCDKIDNNCNAKIDEDRICGGFPWPMFMPAIQSQRP